jgi:hypothetical protein
MADETTIWVAGDRIHDADKRGRLLAGWPQ